MEVGYSTWRVIYNVYINSAWPDLHLGLHTAWVSNGELNDRRNSR